MTARAFRHLALAFLLGLIIAFMAGPHLAHSQVRYKLLRNDAGGEERITKDYGGVVAWYWQKFFRDNPNTHWVVDGYCNSACTMVLGTGNVCATPRAALGFHAGYTYFLFWKVIVPHVSQTMLSAYPPAVQAWVNANGALNQIKPLTFMVGAQAQRFAPSYGVVRGRVEDYVPPCTPQARALARP